MESMDEVHRRRGGLPLYAQLAELLREQIQTGRYRPGDRLPGEPVLTRQYRVSRATVAKALEQLEGDGLVRRRQGRGTFVQPTRMRRPLPELTGFSEHVSKLGLTPGQRVIQFRKRTAEAADPLAGCFGEGTEVVEVERVRLVDGEPVGVHRVVVPAALADRIGLDEDALAAEGWSLYARLSQHGIQLVRAEEHLSAAVATREQASLLGVAKGEPLIHVRRQSWDADGALVEVVDSFHISKRYDYRIDLERAAVD
jgi:GntR family transcriptional regulator